MKGSYYRQLFTKHYRSPDKISDEECLVILGKLDSKMIEAFHQGLLSTSIRFYDPNASRKHISCAVARMISRGDMIVTEKDFHNMEEYSGVEVTMTYKGPVPE